MSQGKLYSALPVLLLGACSEKPVEETGEETGDATDERFVDEACSTLTLTNTGQMEMPWRMTIALGHQDCDSPDLVVFCDADGPVVESGGVEVLSCSNQSLELRATPDQVCVSWEGVCGGGWDRGEPDYSVLSSTGDLDCVEGDFTVQACD